MGLGTELPVQRPLWYSVRGGQAAEAGSIQVSLVDSPPRRCEPQIQACCGYKACSLSRLWGCLQKGGEERRRLSRKDGGPLRDSLSIQRHTLLKRAIGALESRCSVLWVLRTF